MVHLGSRFAAFGMATPADATPKLHNLSLNRDPSIHTLAHRMGEGRVRARVRAIAGETTVIVALNLEVNRGKVLSITQNRAGLRPIGARR